MSKCVPFKIGNGYGFLCMVETDFKCPKCEYNYTEKDYYNQLTNSKCGFIYKRCRGCGIRLGITTDYKGDIRVWLKDDENKLNTKQLWKDQR